MNFITNLFSLCCFVLLTCSCHKDESYYCYHIQSYGYWSSEPDDTLHVFSEGIINKRDRPEGKCQEELDFYAEYYPDEEHHCSCLWELD